jgi:hypothetical protein
MCGFLEVCEFMGVTRAGFCKNVNRKSLRVTVEYEKGIVRTHQRPYLFFLLHFLTYCGLSGGLLSEQGEFGRT